MIEINLTNFVTVGVFALIFFAMVETAKKWIANKPGKAAV